MRNLLTAAVTISLFSTLANTLWMLWESGGGRFRDVGLPRMVRLAGIVLDYDPARLLPEMFQRYHDLTQWSQHFPFDLAADPGEHVNLFGADEERVDALFSGLLDQWWSEGGGKQGAESRGRKAGGGCRD